jgi:Ca2+-binding RTX toxin-like protein
LKGGNDDDFLFGGSGNDTFNGGAGNDRLEGAAGNDIYLFGPGSGVDIVYDYDATPGNSDVVRIEDGIIPSQVTLQRSGENLILALPDTGDFLHISNWFYNDNPDYRVERIEFGDGTVWDVDAIKNFVLTHRIFHRRCASGAGRA